MIFMALNYAIFQISALSPSLPIEKSGGLPKQFKLSSHYSISWHILHSYLLSYYSGRGEHGILGWIEWFRIDYIYQVFPWVFSIINQTEVFGHILALEGHIFSRMFTHSNLFTRWKLASLLKSLEKYQPAYNSSLKFTIFGPPKNKARNWFWQAQTLTWNSTMFR